MIRAEASGIVNAPIEKVWKFMVNLGTMPQRDPSVIRVSWDPPLRVGSVAEIEFRQMGLRRGRYEVNELELNQRLRVQLTAMGARVEATGTWLFDPVANDKTRLSASIQIDIHGLMKLISPFLSISASQGARKGFNRIKSAIEAQGTGGINSSVGLGSPSVIGKEIHPKSSIIAHVWPWESLFRIYQLKAETTPQTSLHVASAGARFAADRT